MQAMSNDTAQSLCERAGIAWHEQADSESLAQLLADEVAASLRAAIETQGNASLVVSGGSTPAAVFKRLCMAELPWQKVSVTLADERWVAPGDNDSNESLVRDTLLVEQASQASFVSLYRAGLSPADAIEPVSVDLKAMQHPFSVTLLGMGADGHTASLFPDAPGNQLASAMSLQSEAMVAVLEPPSVTQTRISLTRSALLNSERRILHITGAEKQVVLRDALLASAKGDGVPGPYEPGLKPIVGLLTHSTNNAAVYWSP